MKHCSTAITHRPAIQTIMYSELKGKFERGANLSAELRMSHRVLSRQGDGGVRGAMCVCSCVVWSLGDVLVCCCVV
ncbi:unnamed protein product, partial [Arctogadus glacialis]